MAEGIGQSSPDDESKATSDWNGEVENPKNLGSQFLDKQVAKKKIR